MEINLKLSAPSLFTHVLLPNSSKEFVYIHTPNKVLVADYDTHFHHFFSATTDEPTHIVLVFAEPPSLQKRTNNLEGEPRGQPSTPFLLLNWSGSAIYAIFRWSASWEIAHRVTTNGGSYHKWVAEKYTHLTFLLDGTSITISQGVFHFLPHLLTLVFKLRLNNSRD